MSMGRGIRFFGLEERYSGKKNGWIEGGHGFFSGDWFKVNLSGTH